MAKNSSERHLDDEESFMERMVRDRAWSILKLRWVVLVRIDALTYSQNVQERSLNLFGLVLERKSKVWPCPN